MKILIEEINAHKQQESLLKNEIIAEIKNLLEENGNRFEIPESSNEDNDDNVYIAFFGGDFSTPSSFYSRVESVELDKEDKAICSVKTERGRIWIETLSPDEVFYLYKAIVNRVLPTL